ncbi:hypothetical protein D3C87_2073540 [compost metagenome]
MGDALAHVVKQIVVGRIISPAQGLLKREGVGRPMALEHQPPQPQQGSAVVATVISTFFEG